MSKLMKSLAAAAVAAGVTMLPAVAQTYWSIPHIEEPHTEFEKRLSEPELQMPGLGLQASRIQLYKRVIYALRNERLSPEEAAELGNSIEKNAESERQMRRQAEGGNLSFHQMQALAHELHDLDLKFEQLTLERETSRPGVDGLTARYVQLTKRIAQGRRHGRLSRKQADRLLAEARLLSDRFNARKSDPEEVRQANRDLRQLAARVERSIFAPQYARGRVQVVTGPHAINAF